MFTGEENWGSVMGVVLLTGSKMKGGKARCCFAQLEWAWSDCGQFSEGSHDAE